MGVNCFWAADGRAALGAAKLCEQRNSGDGNKAEVQQECWKWPPEASPVGFPSEKMAQMALVSCDAGAE